MSVQDSPRYDSGSSIVRSEKALVDYAKLKFDAHTKRLVFSDGLNVDKAFVLLDTSATAL